MFPNLTAHQQEVVAEALSTAARVSASDLAMAADTK
jgi:hypothetical protein